MNEIIRIDNNNKVSGRELHDFKELVIMEIIKDLMYAGVVFASLWMFMAVLCQ